MANQEITARLKLQSEGLTEAANEASRTHKELVGATKAAEQFNRASGGAQKARQAAYSGAMSPQENLAYRQQKGIAELTGAASRDFAKQAQGLGGLVRLYATFAANIFAVSAAFNVLRNAADTTNLINGLNTLGAVSGKALGTLANQLTQASDGAISLRDAMSSVAMTSSAGMSSQNILRLGAVAKSASIALGVSMPDALNRLSRGIVKLEPELLDELGIFTKIEPATQAYALQLGKAVTQLTDFERRQAFANAVIKEGEDKFAALADAAANPYDKLLASLKNVGQSGLELVNKVLVPIIEILGKSPTALGLGLAAIVALLLKQAIPAVAQLRTAFGKRLQDSVEETKNKIEELKGTYKSLSDFAVQTAETTADKRVVALVGAEERLNNFYKESAKKRIDANKVGALGTGALNLPREGLQGVGSLDPDTITQKQFQALKKAQQDYANEVLSSGKAITAEQQKRIDLEKEYIAKLEAAIGGEKNLAEAKKAAAKSALQTLDQSNAGIKLQEDLQKLEKKGSNDRIVQTAVYRANIFGVGLAWKALRADIAAADATLTKFEQKMLLLKGTAGIIGGAFAKAFDKISSALGIVATVGAVFAVLDAAFSKNEKQMQAFSTSTDAAKESVENVKRVLLELDRVGIGKTLIDSSIAISNAMKEVSDSAKKLVRDAILAKDATQGWFDVTVEFVKGIFGQNIEQRLAKNLSSQLQGALKLLRRSGISEEYEKGFRDLLNVSNLSFESVRDALIGSGQETKDAFVELFESAQKELDKTRARLEGFKDASDKALKSYQEFIQSTATSNPLFKLGEGLEVLANEMVSSMQEGVTGIQSMFEQLEKDPKKAALFGKDFISQFAQVKQGFMEQSNAIKQYSTLQNSLQAELKETEDKERQLLELRMAGGVSPEEAVSGAGETERALSEKAQDLRNQIRALQAATIQIPTDKIEEGKRLFQAGLDFSFREGARYIQVALGQASEKASITVAKAWSSVLTGERAAREQTRLAVQELEIQLRAIDTNIQLINSQELLAAELSALTAVSQEQVALLKGDQKAFDAASTSRQAADIYLRFQRGGISDKAALKEAEEAGTDIFNIVRAQIQSAQRKVAEQQASRTLVRGQIQGEKISGELAARRGAMQDEENLAKLTESINQQLQSRLSTLSSIAGVTSKTIIENETAFQQELLDARQTLELKRAELNVDLARSAVANLAKDATADDRKNKTEQLAIEQKNLTLIQRRQGLEKNNLGLQARLKLVQQELDEINKRAEVTKALRAADEATAEAQLEISRARFTSVAELLNLDKQFVANRVYEFDLQRSNLDAERQRNEINASFRQKEQETRTRLRALIVDEAEYSTAVSAELKRQTEIKNYQLAQIETERKKRNDILDITKQQTLEQARQAEQLDMASRYANALAGAFGNAGKTLGDLSVSLIEYEQKQLQNQKQLAYYQNERNLALAEGTVTTQQLTGLNEAEGRAKKKARDDELSGNAKVLGSAKTLFKQNTVAYKTLAALEKAQHIQRMINMGLEFFTKVKNLGLEVAAKATAETQQTAIGFTGFISRIPAYIGEIYGKITSQLGVFGPPVAAGIVAAIFAGLGGGRNKGAAFVPNAEQQQAVQGTAMGYNAKGEKVQVRRGVFGDAEAKSESISKSLEKIKENSVDGLSYDNRILKTLESIDNGINQTAKRLYSIEGLRTGSMFGTVAGTTTGGGLFNTGLFASKTSTEILDAGIKISGSFAELASDTNQGAINFYETVKTTTKRFLRKAKTSINENIDPATETVNDFFTDIFSNARKLITEIGTKTGTQTAAGIDKILSEFEIKDLKISLRGLSGEALAKEVESVISSILDDATLAVFSSFEKYAEFGEGMLETVVRVTDTNEKIAQQIRNLGIGVDLTNLFDVTEAIALAAGGLDTFIEQTQFFRENFLTEAERLAPISQAVGKELGRLSQVFPGLGIEAVDTKEEFKTLVQGLDLTTQGGQTLFNSLMAIQEGFLQVIDAANELTEGQKLVRDLQEEIFDLTSTLSGLDKSFVDIDKKASDYIKQLEKTGEATAENILVIGKWVQATRLDLLKNSVVSAFNAVQDGLKNQISTLATVKQRLVDLKNSLLQGAESVLTPQEKLIAAQTEYNALLAAAKTGDQAAVDKFSGYAQTLLSATRDVYSSGEAYTLAFNRVMQDIDTVTTKVSGDLTTAEQQLQANQDTATGVQAIRDALTVGGKTLAQLQSDFNTAFSDYRKQEAQGAIDAIKESAIKTNIIEIYNKLLGRAPEKAGLDFWTQGVMAGATSLSAVENAIMGSAEAVNYAKMLKEEQEALTAALKPIVTVQTPQQDTTLIQNIQQGIQDFKAAIEKQSTKEQDDEREGKSLDAQANIQEQVVSAYAEIFDEQGWNKEIKAVPLR